ncbi:glycerophosphodiester phosphodiesterase family protein [Amycolatopsis cihanbeyliensis]|uniref:Glycerophosphoryl diester phosphodiesterase n=1 Tax=Amycolatopsis cihanbeyliensis TaxID=1128664 RepID=A0A542DLP0_AMYCI|nr:glycerophosphodiester phosphodiesterase family protein [Amycolatopsis cihanbeyliensis]TQJ04021.1 glycerophosphoryl diester phosphodiesterase [Amycolatopsis cihanbeyliensis]
MSALISAHRGGGEDAPPATLDAYKKSLETGAEYVEFDVRRTRDGELVIFHDERAGRGGPRVDSIGYRELCERAGYHVPELGEVLELIAGEVAGHLDLKETGYEWEVLGLAVEVLGADGFVVTSLEDVSIARIKRTHPGVRAALSLGRELGSHGWHRQVELRHGELFPLRRIRACGADWVAVQHLLARLTVLGLCARHGIGAMVWTVNDDRRIGRLLTDPRVDVLVTDRPRRAVELREKAA